MKEVEFQNDVGENSSSTLEMKNKKQNHLKQNVFNNKSKRLHENIQNSPITWLYDEVYTVYSNSTLVSYTKIIK